MPTSMLPHGVLSYFSWSASTTSSTRFPLCGSRAPIFDSSWHWSVLSMTSSQHFPIPFFWRRLEGLPERWAHLPDKPQQPSQRQVWLRLHLLLCFSHARPHSFLLWQSLGLIPHFSAENRWAASPYSCLNLSYCSYSSVAFQMYQACPALWLENGEQVSYPDGEMTHLPGKYMAVNAGCPLPFYSGAVAKPPEKGEDFDLWALQIYTLPIFEFGYAYPQSSTTGRNLEPNFWRCMVFLKIWSKSWHSCSTWEWQRACFVRRWSTGKSIASMCFAMPDPACWNHCR